MFNLSFTLVYTRLRLNTGISLAMCQVSKFTVFEVYVTLPKTKVNGTLTREKKKRNLLSGQ